MMNTNNQAKKISEFIRYLSMMDDDFEKVKKYDKFISSLEDELNRIVGLSNQFVFSVYFLKEAIARFKQLMRVCEMRALVKICKRKFDKIATAENIKSDKKKDFLSFAKPGITNAHFSNHQVINLDPDDEGEVVNVSTGIRGAFHKNLDQMYPKCSVRGKAPVPTALMAQSELREKRMFVWSVAMHQRFVNAVEALGGILAATPKKVKELMKVADLTEEDIKIHMLNYGPARVMVSQDVIKKGKNVIQSGSQTLHIGKLSNGQAAGAAGSSTSGGWVSVCRVSDLLPSVREMLVRSGAVEVPEFSSSQMAAANETYGGWKFVNQPYINGPMNNLK